MKGEPLKLARRALQLFVHSLTSTYCNISIQKSFRWLHLPDHFMRRRQLCKLVWYTSQIWRASSARGYTWGWYWAYFTHTNHQIEKFAADMGGNSANLLNPLRAVYSPSVSQHFFFLIAGERISQSEEIQKLVSQSYHSSQSKTFCLAFSSNANVELLTEICTKVLCEI